MTNWLVPPSSPTGNSRRIELSGIDLWIFSRINNVFVYPSDLDVDRLNDTLGRALSLWPLVAGRFLIFDGNHYIIEMSDNAIPVSMVENTDLAKWPLDSNVMVESTHKPLQPFLDEVEVTKLLSDSNDEPLFRLKLTRLVQSGELVLGVSWAHVLGDGAACSNFLSTISRLYQQMEPLEPFPVVERRLWREDEGDQSLVSMMKQLRDAGSSEGMTKNYMADEATYNQLNMCFSSEQLAILRTLAGGNSVTIQDALTAYIILILNTHCFQNDVQSIILRTNMIINFRGVSDSIAPRGLVANAVVSMLSDDFDDPLSLSSIAKAIRRLVVRSRDTKFLESWVATADELMRKMVQDGRRSNLGPFSNEIVVNSALRYDWAGLVDFGYTDKCRVYMSGTSALCIRVFRLNPVYNGTQWMGRDRGGAEISFGIHKDMKEKFISAWQQDVIDNFVNVKN
jgi:hypothetical protein